jgi:hypothetical protein
MSDCTYPICDCLALGGQCQRAQRASEDQAIAARKALEPRCSVCHLPDSETKWCERTECQDGIAEMVQP